VYKPGVPCSATQVYTPTHRAPEMELGRSHDQRLDTWLVGCLVLELRSGLPPWFHVDTAPGLSEAEKDARKGAEELAREDCPYRQVLTQGELEFATTCLERDITKRPFLSWLYSAEGLHKYYCGF
jgi:serine/threonine protein kinase